MKTIAQSQFQKTPPKVSCQRAPFVPIADFSPVYISVWKSKSCFHGVLYSRWQIRMKAFFANFSQCLKETQAHCRTLYKWCGQQVPPTPEWICLNPAKGRALVLTPPLLRKTLLKMVRYPMAQGLTLFLSSIAQKIFWPNEGGTARDRKLNKLFRYMQSLNSGLGRSCIYILPCTFSSLYSLTSKLLSQHIGHAVIRL